jgi:hypothetical protein
MTRSVIINNFKNNNREDKINSYKSDSVLDLNQSNNPSCSHLIDNENKGNTKVNLFLSPSNVI